MPHLPPLIMIRAFEAVGRTGSMRKAAEAMGVSHNVVSYHVRNLEAWIGLKLVERGVADARAAGRKIIPLCPFAAAQFRRHPEWADVLKG